MNTLKSVLTRIDSVSTWTGKVASWLLIVLIGCIAYNVFMRYALNAPLIIDIALNFILFFPLVFFIFLTSLKTTIHSWEIRELASTTIFYPPIYPLRTVITIALFLLLLQGIANVARSLSLLIKGGNYG